MRSRYPPRPLAIQLVHACHERMRLVLASRDAIRQAPQVPAVGRPRNYHETKGGRNSWLALSTPNVFNVQRIAHCHGVGGVNAGYGVGGVNAGFFWPIDGVGLSTDALNWFGLSQKKISNFQNNTRSQ
jgi:hypothetical protein